MLKKAIKCLLALSFLATIGLVIYNYFFRKNEKTLEINHPHGKRLNRGWQNRKPQGQQRRYDRRGLQKIR